MPVESNHQEYTDNIHNWSKCRHVVDGEGAVKSAGETYLPRLTEQTDAEYQAYRQRALFYGASGRTVAGLSGAILRKPPKFQGLTEEERESLKTVGCSNESIKEIIKCTVREILTQGRYGLLVDSEDAGDDYAEPYISQYYAENIVNWRTKVINGRERLILVVLKEIEYDYEARKDRLEEYDEFKPKRIEQRRVLRLVDLGEGEYEYQVEVWQKKEDVDKKAKADETTKIKTRVRLNQSQGPKSKKPGESWQRVGETIIPKVIGKSLDYIPFQFFSPEGTGSAVEKSPILDLADANLSHFRTSADLEHGRHFTALPTAWVAGFDPKTTKLKIGSSTAWVAKEPGAHAGFLEFSGSGLGHLSNALKEKQELMAVLGSRLLEEQKAGVEAADTVRLRQSGEGSVLAGIARAASEGIENVLEWLLKWGGKAEPDVGVELNKDFGPAVMDPALLQSLMAAYQAGMISFDTWYYNLKNGEIVPDDSDLETEKGKIELGGPTPKAPPGSAVPEQAGADLGLQQQQLMLAQQAVEGQAA